MHWKYFDGKLLIDGYLKDLIKFDQAVHLCKIHPDSAWWFLTDLFIEEFKKERYQPEMSLESARSTDAYKLLRLFWELFGIEKGTEICMLHRNGAVDWYLQEEIMGRGSIFPEDLLERLQTAYHGHKIASMAYDRKCERLANLARALMKDPVEINKDVQAVKERIDEYKFSPELNEILGKIADELAAGGDEFDQAANLKHLRTFFEKLHEQVGTSLRIAKPSITDRADLSKFGQAIDYLERNGVLTPKMKELPKSLYGILSNEGVHAFKSEKEYVRLCRNMVIEYAIVLFFELERRLSIH